jgi:hypothetical protein
MKRIHEGLADSLPARLRHNIKRDHMSDGILLAPADGKACDLVEDLRNQADGLPSSEVEAQFAE